MRGKKRPIEDDIPSLPEHIVTFQIFSRLPVKSLYKFRCVSKWFRSLTTHRGFLDAYHRHSHGRYLLSFRSSLHWDCVFYTLIDPDLSGKARAILINQVKNIHCGNYAKSINGLLCISRNNGISICQVATNEKVFLPKIPCYNGVQPHTQHIYFCYDPKSRRYKVLGTISILNDVFQVERTKCMIFTIGLDMSWREIYAPELYHLRKAKSVCLDGVLYCTNFSTSLELDKGVIAGFDVANECFKIISYPKGLSSSRYSSCYIIEVKGSLCVIDTGDLIKSCFMTMWVHNSKDYNHLDCESWMEYRIEFPSRWRTMVNSWHNCSFCSNSDEEIVVAVSGISTIGCYILIYNIQRKQWRKMEILGLAKLTILGDFLIEGYVESPYLLSDIFQTKAS